LIHVKEHGPTTAISAAMSQIHEMATKIPADDIPDLGPQAYAGWRSSTVGAITETLQRRLILERLGDVCGRSVLDIGCGDGALAVELWKRGAIVTGIDVSREMIEAAQANAKQEGADIRFMVAAAERIPFPSDRFDVVSAVTILCFVENAAPVFAEIARVLRPGGRLVIGELGKWSSWAAARRIRAWLGSQLWRRGHFRTADQLKALAQQAGLVAGPVRGATYYPRWTPAARLLARWDAQFSRITTIGAAFLALSAVKPARQTPVGGADAGISLAGAAVGSRSASTRERSV
jgi:ubiquinone biosynthesis O-methyltransferase